MIKRNKKGRKLSREKNQRRALLRSLAISLIEKKRIKTTLARAKELRPYIEKKITQAKRCFGKGAEVKVAKIRLLKKDFSQENIKEIFRLAELFKNRAGGYVRIIKVSARKSDNALMAIIEWTEKLANEEGEELKKNETIKKDKEKVKKSDKKKAKTGKKEDN